MPHIKHTPELAAKYNMCAVIDGESVQIWRRKHSPNSSTIDHGNQSCQSYIQDRHFFEAKYEEKQTKTTRNKGPVDAESLRNILEIISPSRTDEDLRLHGLNDEIEDELNEIDPIEERPRSAVSEYSSGSSNAKDSPLPPTPNALMPQPPSPEQNN